MSKIQRRHRVAKFANRLLRRLGWTAVVRETGRLAFMRMREREAEMKREVAALFDRLDGEE